MEANFSSDQCRLVSFQIEITDMNFKYNFLIIITVTITSIWSRVVKF